MTQHWILWRFAQDLISFAAAISACDGSWDIWDTCGAARLWDDLLDLGKIRGLLGKPLQKTMENHNFYRVNQLFLWPFSIANC